MGDRAGTNRWRLKQPSDIEAADEGLLETLDALDGATNYRDWILELAGPFLGPADTILEVGAGHGTFTQELCERAHVTATELGREGLERLRSRFSATPSVTISDLPLAGLPSDAFDVAFLSNVLEHIEDDVEALRDLARVVRPGGTVVVFSPAFAALYSDFDRRIGHHHRYRLPEIRRRFEAAGLQVEESCYVNSVGFFSWLIFVRLLRVTPENTRAVQMFDRRVVPWLRRLEARRPPPLGQSVFVVGRVPLLV
jgi:SAM-dependent methyltransferase